MKILFDYQIFLLQKYGGISTYYFNLVNEFIKKCHVSKIIAPLYISELFRDLNISNVVVGKRIDQIPRFTSKIITYLNDLFFEYYVKKTKPDIVHQTYYNKIFNFNKVKKIITVYDLIHEKFFNKKFKKKKSIEIADHIICISKNTQNELIDYYKVNSKKTSVIYLASKFCYNKNKDKILINNPDPYLLFVGDRSKYKNFNNFIKSISRSNLLKNKIKIICFGIYPFTKNELELFKSEKIIKENIIFINGSDELLKTLYLNSTALIYPSLHEGFGLPIIEAMSLGCPVACSDISSIREVAGNAANFFDPINVDSMTHSIEDIVFSTQKRKVLIEQGFHQADKFSWNKCALETLNVYNSVL